MGGHRGLERLAPSPAMDAGGPWFTRTMLLGSTDDRQRGFADRLAGGQRRAMRSGVAVSSVQAGNSASTESAAVGKLVPEAYEQTRSKGWHSTELRGRMPLPDTEAVK